MALFPTYWPWQAVLVLLYGVAYLLFTSRALFGMRQPGIDGEILLLHPSAPNPADWVWVVLLPTDDFLIMSLGIKAAIADNEAFGSLLLDQFLKISRSGKGPLSDDNDVESKPMTRLRYLGFIFDHPATLGQGYGIRQSLARCPTP